MAKNWIIESAVETDEIVLNDAGSPIAFRIEGDADPNLFVVDGKTDKVGIGTASPEGQFDVISASTDSEFHVINGYRYGNTKYSAHITVRKARGTASSPSILSWDASTASLQDDVGTFFAEAWDGGKFIHSGGMVVLTDGQYSSNVFGSNKIPSRVNLNINDGTSSSTTPALSVASDKTVVVGDLASYGGARKKPAATLEVLGGLTLLKGGATAATTVTTSATANNNVVVNEILTDGTVTTGWSDTQLITAQCAKEMFDNAELGSAVVVTSATSSSNRYKLAHLSNHASNGTLGFITAWSLDATSLHIGDTIPSGSHEAKLSAKGSIKGNSTLFIGASDGAEFGDANDTHKAGVSVEFQSDTANKIFKWDGDNTSLTLGVTGGATRGVDFKVYGDANSGTAANERSMFWDASGNNLILAATNLRMSHTSNSHITPIGAAASGFTHGNDVPLIVQAHAGNTTAPITDFRNESGATMAEIKADGSIAAQGSLTLKRGKYLNFQQDVTASPSDTGGVWMYNNTGANMILGASGITLLGTGGTGIFSTMTPHGSTGLWTVTGATNGFRRINFGDYSNNSAFVVETNNDLADARFTEDTNNYRGIYTSNLKIDNNDGVIEAIGADANEGITLRAKGAGVTRIGGNGGVVTIGHSTSLTEVEQNLTVKGNLSVTGSFSGSVTGLDQYGTDQAYFKINKDTAASGIRLTATDGETLTVHNDGATSIGTVQASKLTNTSALNIETSGSNGDINLVPNGSGDVVIGSAANNANLTVNGTIEYKGSLTTTGLDLNGDLDIETQATTIKLKDSETSALVVRQGSSGQAFLQMDTSDDDLHLCPSNSTADAHVTIWDGNINTDHHLKVYGRNSATFFEVTTDNDTQGLSGANGVNVIGHDFFVGKSSVPVDATFYGTEGDMVWDGSAQTLTLGANTSNDDQALFRVYGYTSDEYIDWDAEAAATFTINGKIAQNDSDFSLGNGALLHIASSNTIGLTPAAGGNVSMGRPIVHSGYNVGATTDTQTTTSGNDIYCNTGSGSITLGGVVPIVAGATIPLFIHKTHASNSLIIEHAEGGGINDFNMPNAQDLTITDIGVYEFRYNDVTNRWYPVTGTIHSLIEDVTATNIITAGESGTTFFLNSATEFVSTLPAPSAGLEYTFIIKAAPSGANYTVVTNSSANILIGGVTCQTADDLGAYDNNGDTITFVGGQAIVGDRVHCISDGTSWYVDGHCFVAEGITITGS